jgi:hypothetical protein
MFPNLMLVADDFGSFDADPRVLLANCFPMRSDHVSRRDIEKWRDEMVSAGLIALYRHEDHVFGYFVKWSKYSKPHNTSKRKFPEPNGNSSLTPIHKKSRKSTKDSLGFTQSHLGSPDLTLVHSVSPPEVEVEVEEVNNLVGAVAPEVPVGSSSNGHRGSNDIPNGEAHTPAASPPAWPSPESLVALYNAMVPPGHPRVTVLSPKRRDRCLEYLRRFPDEAFWRRAFATVAGSLFLQGKKPSEGHQHFVADFDWFLQGAKGGGVENVVKVAEGKYKPDILEDDDDAA